MQTEDFKVGALVQAIESPQPLGVIVTIQQTICCTVFWFSEKVRYPEFPWIASELRLIKPEKELDK